MAVPTNLHRDLGRMEGKLDAVLTEMRAGLRNAHTRLDGHENRIMDLEGLKPLGTVIPTLSERLEIVEDREQRRSGAFSVLKSAYVTAAALFGATATYVSTHVLKLWGVE